MSLIVLLRGRGTLHARDETVWYGKSRDSVALPRFARKRGQLKEDETASRSDSSRGALVDVRQAEAKARRRRRKMSIPSYASAFICRSCSHSPCMSDITLRYPCSKRKKQEKRLVLSLPLAHKGSENTLPQEERPSCLEETKLQ